MSAIKNEPGTIGPPAMEYFIMCEPVHELEKAERRLNDFAEKGWRVVGSCSAAPTTLSTMSIVWTLERVRPA